MKHLPLLFILCLALFSNAAGMDVSGTWRTWELDHGERYFDQEIEFTQSGDSITCKFLHLHNMVGTISGGSFGGTFRNDNPEESGYGETFGHVEMTFSSDGKSFTGRWQNREEDPWTAWEGEKISESSEAGNAVDTSDNGSGYYVNPPGTEYLAFLKEIKGNGLVWIDGLPIKPGEQIKILGGSRISTGPGTEVVVKFDTGAFTILKEKTDFVVKKEKIVEADYWKIFGNVLRGIANFYVEPHAEAREKFEVETDLAIVGIKGTIFNVEHYHDSTIVEVAEGAVAVESKATGEEVTVNAGERIVVTADGLSEIGSFDTESDISKWREIISEVEAGERASETSNVIWQSNTSSMPVGETSADVQTRIWTGTWDTSWGPMELQQSGAGVTGTYTHDQGLIQGTVFGNKLIGTWSEAPSYSPPNDAGDVELILSYDCNSFRGKWRYDSSGTWDDWTGTRK